MNKKLLRLISLCLAPILVIGFFFFVYKFVYKVQGFNSLLSQTPNVVELISQKPSEDPGKFPFKLPKGYTISVFAHGLDNPGKIEFSPGGTLLVSSPKTGKIFAIVSKNGQQEIKTVLSGLGKPYGLTFYQNKLYVAEETRVVRYAWDEANLAAIPDKYLFSMPNGGIHGLRNIVFDQNGRMFVSIGSSCDNCKEDYWMLGSITVSNAEGDNPRLFAKGFRNAGSLTIDPATQKLWASDQEGSKNKPDEVNLVKEGSDYGWPGCYGNNIHDKIFDPVGDYTQQCKESVPPTLETCAQCNPMGMAFWQGNLLVTYHGSGVESEGDKIILLKIKNGSVVSKEDFLTGFIKETRELGKPLDITTDKNGSIFVSDDKSGVIYKISQISSATSKPPTQSATDAATGAKEAEVDKADVAGEAASAAGKETPKESKGVGETVVSAVEGAIKAASEISLPSF